jgi:hypothetical protein
MSLRSLFHALTLTLLLVTNVCSAKDRHHRTRGAKHRQHATPSVNLLNQQYAIHCREQSDIHEHLPVLAELSRECSSVVEIGVRTVVSTWGILQGLSESPHYPRSYLGIDLSHPPHDKFNLARELANQHQISFNFLQGNDLDFEIEPADMIFIDTLHIYCQLSAELEKFAPKAKKYITMHDTSAPWGDQNEGYGGDYSEYPAQFDCTKQGLWQAVVDFLARHPEWELKERRLNNHGFTTLVRVQN